MNTAPIVSRVWSFCTTRTNIHHTLKKKPMRYEHLDDLPEPEDLAAQIIENLEAGIDSFRRVLAGLESE